MSTLETTRLAISRFDPSFEYLFNDKRLTFLDPVIPVQELISEQVVYEEIVVRVGEYTNPGFTFLRSANCIELLYFGLHFPSLALSKGSRLLGNDPVLADCGDLAGQIIPNLDVWPPGIGLFTEFYSRIQSSDRRLYVLYEE